MSIPKNPAADARQSLDSEADLVDRFARMYRAQLGELVRALNATGQQPTDVDPIRRCVEAVDMVLASHAQFARSLKQFANAVDVPTGPVAA
jgi:hypothetical protein